ncbi:MAG: hypothetical protein HY814_03490 [Candidatus Riflebacteria bacterium]|nr:hypothetical protein [Candidatus Riflebacteria bacterium]
MALPILVAIIFVLVTLILAFHTYSSQRIRATGAVLNGFSALAAAEAGLNCVLLEMRNSQGWFTHELELDSGGQLVWKEPLSRPNRIAGATGLSVKDTRKGAYTATVGAKPFHTEFAVRVGRIPLEDDPTTPAIDESRRFVRIESIGKKEDPTGRLDRFTKIAVVAEVSNFTEYVVYDGEKVVLGMGSHNDAHHSNVFADGRIYGHEAVKLGNIEQNGTVQKFVNLDCVRSAGTLEYKDTYQVTFQKPKALSGKTIELNPSNDSDGPTDLQTASGNVLDGSHGGSLSIPRLDKEFYRRQAAAGGLDVSGRPTSKEPIVLYPGELKEDLIELNFGRGGYEGGPVPADDKTTLGADYPADFNGLVYSSKPLTVWGNPDRDVTIFCEDDIFISGDFNLSPDHRQNYRPKFQTADGTAIDGTPFYQYRLQDLEKYVEGAASDLVEPAQRERVAVALISMGRIWFDYRHPTRFLANELKGLIKLEVVSRLLGDEPTAYEWVRYQDATPPPSCPPIPATDVKQPGANGADDLTTSLQLYLGRGGVGSAADNLWVTTASYDVIKQSFVDAVADGSLSREDLDGAPGKPGVADAIVERLLMDEPQYPAHWPASNDPDLKDLTPPQLGAFTAPQRLYHLVYDEHTANLNSHPPLGKYSDQEGTRQPMMEDELYMPQMSMYAMLFISARRNDDPAEASTDDPKSMNRRFDDLGNARGKKVHFLTTIQGLEEQKAGNLRNITTPLIQRFFGSEIRMAQVANWKPALQTGNYWPPLRRRIYDATLSVRPPPMIPQSVELRTWEQSGATKKDYEAFAKE